MDRKIEVLKRSIGKNKEKKIYSIQNFLQKKLGRKDLKINKIEELEEIIDQLEDSDFENMFDKMLENGNPLPWKGAAPGERILVYHSSGVFIGIYQWQEERKLYKPEAIFSSPEDFHAPSGKEQI